jgi:hypothetical protein
MAPSFFTSALDGGEWSASLSRRFTPGIHWIGGWVGPRVILDAVERKIFHCLEYNPGRPARRRSLYRLLVNSGADTANKMTLRFNKIDTLHKFTRAATKSPHLMVLFNIFSSVL